MKKILITSIIVLSSVYCFSQTDTFRDTINVNTLNKTKQENNFVRVDTMKTLMGDYANFKMEDNHLTMLESSSSNQLTIGLKKKKNHNENLEWVKIAGLYTASVILNAMGDALNNSNRKTVGHMCNGASIGLLVASPFLVKYNTKKWYWYLASYVSLRVGLFDATYNTVKGLPLNFTGTTSPTDITYNKMEINPNFTRSLCLTLGMSIPIVLL
ncbi:MAG: hypothetical protein P4L34_06340 [Paludibacter sp.]|nr:hypothetical protein [Paludibacter sp.]